MTDFERLLQGKVKLRDLTEEQIAAVKTEVQQREQADIEQIPDKTTRETMLRWSKLFPPS